MSDKAKELEAIRYAHVLRGLDDVTLLVKVLRDAYWFAVESLREDAPDDAVGFMDFILGALREPKGYADRLIGPVDEEVADLRLVLADTLEDGVACTPVAALLERLYVLRRNAEGHERDSS